VTLTNKTISGADNTLVAVPQSAILGLDASLSQLAPKLSPALIGIPTSLTANRGNNSTQIATTAFVQDAIFSGGAASTIGAFYLVKAGGKMTGVLQSAFPTVTSVNRTNLLPNPSFEVALSTITASGPGIAAAASVSTLDAALGNGTHSLAYTISCRNADRPRVRRLGTADRGARHCRSGDRLHSLVAGAYDARSTESPCHDDTYVVCKRRYNRPRNDTRNARGVDGQFRTIYINRDLTGRRRISQYFLAGRHLHRHRHRGNDVVR